MSWKVLQSGLFVFSADQSQEDIELGQCRFSCWIMFWYPHTDYLPDRRKVVVSSVKTC